MIRTILYIFASLVGIGVLGFAFYFVAGKDTFLLGDQKPTRTVLPKIVSAQEVLVPPSPEPPPPSPEPPAPSPEPPPPPYQPQRHTISIESSGFVPQKISITVGDTVRWVNNDAQLHWPATDPHPTHTGVPEFDPLADLFPGESFSYTFTQPGSYGYHDHTQAVIDDVATITGIVRVLPLPEN